jgi:hypothetical protein
LHAFKPDESQKKPCLSGLPQKLDSAGYAGLSSCGVLSHVNASKPGTPPVNKLPYLAIQDLTFPLREGLT